MAEHVTRQISPDLLLAEFSVVCEALIASGSSCVTLMFGWGSELDIDEMWKKQFVAMSDVRGVVAEAVSQGILTIGQADIHIQVPDFEFKLCHESDMHISGSLPLVEQLSRRWASLGYSRN